MKLHELPWFQQFLDDPEKATWINKLNEDSEAMIVAFFGRKYDHYRKIVIANGTGIHQKTCQALGKFLARWADAAEEEGRMFPTLIKKVYVDQFLANRAIYRLRSLISTCSGGDDEDKCIEWLQESFDITDCNECGEWEYARHIQNIDENYVCRSCVESSYVWSDYCEAYIYNDDAVSGLDRDGDPVTFRSGDDDFHWHERLNTYVHYDYEEPEREIIRGYHTSKRDFEPIFDAWSASKVRWFGVELEMEVADDREAKAKQLHESVNGGEMGKFCFFERDGSVPRGFEMITQPMSLPAHQEYWKWLNDMRLRKGLTSHDTTTCGLHVHVTKQALSPLQIAKIVSFVNAKHNCKLIETVARRYNAGFCVIKNKHKLSAAKESEDRYEAVNLTNRKTIEFRIFKGSLKYQSVMAAIEFCNALIEFTRPASSGGINNLNTADFLVFITTQLRHETKHLRNYLKNRSSDLAQAMKEEAIEEQQAAA